MARTAPPGYESNYAAILDVLRYGFAIWTLPQMAALLYHAERSTAVGRDSDQHSQDQAINGIYSTRALAWVRGPAGVSRSTWNRSNGELLISDDPQKVSDKDRPRVLRKKRRTNKAGRDDATEFEIDWLRVRAAIGEWKSKDVSQRGTLEKNLSVPAWDSQCPSVGHYAISGPGTASECPSVGHTVDSYGLSQVRQTECPSVGHYPVSAVAISGAIEDSLGERVRTDGPINRILHVAQKLDLPEEAVVRFIHDKAFDFRGRNYKANPGLLAKAIAEDALRWLRENHRFVEDLRRKRDLEAQRIAAVEQMKPPEPETSDPQQFRDELLRTVAAQRRKAGRG